MTSKWIKEISDVCNSREEWAGTWYSIEETLNKIDKLLVESMLETDDEKLFERILEETNEIS